MNTTNTPNNPYETRWLIRLHMPQIMAIETSLNSTPWSEENFTDCLRERNCIGMVADTGYGTHIDGFIIYEVNANHINVLRFEATEREAAAAMVATLIRKLSQQRREHFTIHIRESDLATLFMLREIGAVATRVHRQFFGPDEDGVELRYDLSQQSATKGERVNRWESIPA